MFIAYTVSPRPNAPDSVKDFFARAAIEFGAFGAEAGVVCRDLETASIVAACGATRPLLWAETVAVREHEFQGGAARLADLTALRFDDARDRRVFSDWLETVAAGLDD